MIVMITDQQILSPKQVCQNCLMSDQTGLPRWQNSQLGCAIKRSQSPQGFTSEGVSAEVAPPPQTSKQAQIYQCQMGFKVTWVK